MFMRCDWRTRDLCDHVHWNLDGLEEKKDIISIITEWVTHFILQWRSGEAKKILNMKTLFLKYAQEMVLVVFVDEKITEYLAPSSPSNENWW